MIVHCPKCGGDFHITVTDPKSWLEMYRERTATGVPVLPCFDCPDGRRPQDDRTDRDPWLDAPLTPEEIDVFERAETEDGEPW